MRKPTNLQTRSDDQGPKLTYRSMSLRMDSEGRPSTLDEDNRSVEVIGATEEPVEVFDYERFEVVPEILLMSGCEMPSNRQVPLLDTHRRFEGTSSVLGSYREMRTEDDQLVGRTFFSSVADAEGPYTKMREGHLTDFSAGYRPIKSVWVPDGQKATIEGRSFEGPVRVTTRWRIKELSICPIGADELAKARAESTQTPPNRRSQSQENEVMNEALRKWLEKRGLATDATEAEAWAFYVRMLDDLNSEDEQPPEVGNDQDVRAAIDQAIRVERERVTTIRAMCTTHGCEDLADGMISEGVALNNAREQVMNHIVEHQPEINSRGPAAIVAEERDKFRSAAQDALIIRAGIGAIETPAPGATDLVGFSLRELARECLRMANLEIGGNPMEMVGRAMQSSDFPLLLSNTANKALFEGWNTAEETWSVWVGTGSVSDFKQHTLPRASEMEDLDEIPDHGEYKYGKRTEASEAYQIATFGKLFAITRQTIINDDLGALTDVPQGHGEAAQRKLGDIVYAVVTANAAMGDGVALFHNNHKNLAGSGAVPGVETLAAGILAMGTQKDIKGKRRLNIRPEYYLAPKALEGSSEVFFRSEKFDDTSKDTTRVNPYSGTYFTRVYEPRLDDDDAARWYLAARKGKTVKIFFLNGIQTPYLETKQGWSVDGVEYKVRIDAGAKAVDWRGLYSNPGD
jgi:hypothetical protein